MPHSDRDEPALDEVARYETKLAHRDMVILPKTHADARWNGKDNWDPSNLDHVFASDNLSFKRFDAGASIDIRGWPTLNTKAQKKCWIEKHSDHALLYGEVHD